MKKSLKFEANNKQKCALEGLAYWIADNAYIIERYGADEPELKTVNKTISLLFENLDALCVPFWVQNAVICFSENWRKYKETYLSSFLKTKNIYI